jgi:hypothetical protein
MEEIEKSINRDQTHPDSCGFKARSFIILKEKLILT